MRTIRVVLREQTRAAITRLAARLWPREMVAALAGGLTDDCHTVTAVSPLPNIALVGDRFAVDPVAFARTIAELEAAGLAFLGFVHSHPSGAAELSDVDRRELWRDCLQLVVATDPHAPTAMAAFWLQGDAARELPFAPGT